MKIKNFQFTGSKNQQISKLVIYQSKISIQKLDDYRIKINNKPKPKQMGNEQIKKGVSDCQQVDSPHPMLSHTYIQTFQNQQLLKAEWHFYSQQQFHAWEKKYSSFVQQCEGRDKIVTQNSRVFLHFFLPIHPSYTNVATCSSSGVVAMYYPIVSHALIQDLQQKAKTNEPFLEGQIWTLILQLTESLTYAHSKSIPIGDIRSENILVDISNKRAMLATEVSWMGDKPFKQKVKCGDQVFVSAQMDQIHQEDQIQQHVEISNDDFSLGMTLAECILLEDLSKIYQKTDRKKKINKEKYEKLIESLLKIKYYSLKLLLIVIGLVQFERKSRLSCCQVYQLIKPHEAVILGNKEFNLTKQSLIQACPQKYAALQTILKQFKSKNNRQMFQNKQLITSRAVTINGISTVQNVKRTFDQTFNLSFLDYSKNQIQKHFKFSAVYNQSQNNERQLQQYSNINRSSEVRLPHYHTRNFSQQKLYPKPNLTLNTLRPQAEMAVSEVKEIISNVKQWKPCLIPVTNEQQNQVNTARVLNSQPYTTSFSFHSPDSKVKVQDEDFQTPKRKTLFQARSVSQSTETLLIMPSVYSVSNPPESYISYHYSNQLSKKQQPKGTTNKSQLQMSINFQDYSAPKPTRLKSSTDDYSKEKIQGNYWRRMHSMDDNHHLHELLGTRSQQKSDRK